MTRNIAWLVFALFIVIVNLAIEDDDLLRRIAGHARPAAVQTEVPAPAPLADAPAPPAPRTVPLPVAAPAPAEEPPPVDPATLPERLAPRVE